MDIRTVLSVCNMVIIASIVINALDYNMTGRRGFFLFPRSWAARRFFMGWSAVLAIMALLNVLRLLPPIYSIMVLGAYVLSSQGYAVFCRHARA